MIVELHDAASAELDDAAAWYEGQQSRFGYGYDRAVVGDFVAHTERNIDVLGDHQPARQ